MNERLLGLHQLRIVAYNVIRIERDTISSLISQIGNNNHQNIVLYPRNVKFCCADDKATDPIDSIYKLWEGLSESLHALDSNRWGVLQLSSNWIEIVCVSPLFFSPRLSQSPFTMGGDWLPYFYAYNPRPAQFMGEHLIEVGLVPPTISSSGEYEQALRVEVEFVSYLPPVIEWAVNNMQITHYSAENHGFRVMDPYDIVRGETWGTRLIATSQVKPGSYQVQCILPQTGEARSHIWSIKPFPHAPWSNRCQHLPR